MEQLREKLRRFPMTGGQEVVIHLWKEDPKLFAIEGCLNPIGLSSAIRKSIEPVGLTLPENFEKTFESTFVNQCNEALAQKLKEIVWINKFKYLEGEELAENFVNYANSKGRVASIDDLKQFLIGNKTVHIPETLIAKIEETITKEIETSGFNASIYPNIPLWNGRVNLTLTTKTHLPATVFFKDFSQQQNPALLPVGPVEITIRPDTFLNPLEAVPESYLDHLAKNLSDSISP